MRRLYIVELDDGRNNLTTDPIVEADVIQDAIWEYFPYLPRENVKVIMPGPKDIMYAQKLDSDHKSPIMLFASDPQFKNAPWPGFRVVKLPD